MPFLSFSLFLISRWFRFLQNRANLHSRVTPFPGRYCVLLQPHDLHFITRMQRQLPALYLLILLDVSGRLFLPLFPPQVLAQEVAIFGFFCLLSMHWKSKCDNRFWGQGDIFFHLELSYFLWLPTGSYFWHFSSFPLTSLVEFILWSQARQQHLWCL